MNFNLTIANVIIFNKFGGMYKEIKQNLLSFLKEHPCEGSSFQNSRRDDIGIEIWLKKKFDPFLPFEADFSCILEDMIPENEDWEKERKTIQPFIENINLIIDQIQDNIKDGELDYLMITKEGVNVDKKYYPNYISDKERIRVFPNMSLPIDPYYTTKLVHPKIKVGNPPIEILSEAKYTMNSALKDKEITQSLILNGGKHKKLTAIPEEIKELKNLRKLVIKEIPIKEIPAWIKDLKELRSLTISPSKEDTAQNENPCLINEIPDELWELKNLQYLSIRNTNIKKISKNIEQLTNLIELDISENQLIDIPSSIGKLENLEKLKVRSSIPHDRTEYYYNEKPLRKSWVVIDSVNEGLSEDEYLKKYNVEIRTNNNLYSGLTRIPKSISKIRKLTYLDLSGNTELQLSDEIGKLTELRELYINEMDLKEIPEGIQNNIKLHTLSIDSNPNIKEVPVWLDKLQNLKNLKTYGCRFSVIPDTLNKLDMPNLENGQEIFAHINFSELPSLFLKQKRTLMNGIISSSWSNSLEKLPDWIGMLSQNIYDNGVDIRGGNRKHKFTEIPESFGELVNIQVLSLDGHHLSQLPSSMKNLTNVTRVHLENNKFTELPEVIQHMKKLKRLSFQGNDIKKVPDWIGKLKNLRYLSVSESTEKIPDSILKLKKLTKKRIESSEEAYNKKFPGL